MKWHTLLIIGEKKLRVLVTHGIAYFQLAADAIKLWICSWVETNHIRLFCHSAFQGCWLFFFLNQGA